jgi:hypothetical protein
MPMTKRRKTLPTLFVVFLRCRETTLCRLAGRLQRVYSHKGPSGPEFGEVVARASQANYFASLLIAFFLKAPSRVPWLASLLWPRVALGLPLPPERVAFFGVGGFW